MSTISAKGKRRYICIYVCIHIYKYKVFSRLWTSHINHKAYKAYYHWIISLQDPESRDVIKSDKDSSTDPKDWIDIDGLSPVYTAQEVGPFEIFVVNGTGGQMGTLPYKRDRVSKRDENTRLWLCLCCIWTPCTYWAFFHIMLVMSIWWHAIGFTFQLGFVLQHIYIYLGLGLGVIRRCETCQWSWCFDFRLPHQNT